MTETKSCGMEKIFRSFESEYLHLIQRTQPPQLYRQPFNFYPGRIFKIEGNPSVMQAR